MHQAMTKDPLRVAKSWRDTLRIPDPNTPSLQSIHLHTRSPIMHTAQLSSVQIVVPSIAPNTCQHK